MEGPQAVLVVLLTKLNRRPGVYFLAATTGFVMGSFGRGVAASLMHSLSPAKDVQVAGIVEVDLLQLQRKRSAPSTAVSAVDLRDLIQVADQPTVAFCPFPSASDTEANFTTIIELS